MLIKQTDCTLTRFKRNGNEWAHELLDQIKTRFLSPAGTRDGFPCIFAQNAYALSNIRFLCISYDTEINDYDYCTLADGLELYLAKAKINQSNDNINTLEPLLVLFEPNDMLKTVIDCENIFIRSLQYLINHDPCEWAGSIPKDPNAEFWTMSYCATQIFINVSHPYHRNRRSRNLCDTLVFVINPRERFDIVAGNNKKGHAMRSRIRKNIDIYDNIPRSPFLGHYQAGELEWPQYMLPDDNEASALKCPLKFR